MLEYTDMNYTNRIYYAIKDSVPLQYRPYVTIKATADNWYMVCYGMITSFYRMSNDGKILEIQYD